MKLHEPGSASEKNKCRRRSDLHGRGIWHFYMREIGAETYGATCTDAGYGIICLSEDGREKI